jgi:hypothetical protein
MMRRIDENSIALADIQKINGKNIIRLSLREGGPDDNI